MEERVLATVGGMAVTERDVTQFLASLGQRGQAYNNPEGRAAILEELINRKLFLLEASRNLFEAEPAFKAQLKQAKESLLINYAIEKATSQATVKEEEITAFYEENRDRLGGGERLVASHILVESEEQAAALREKIVAGEISFEDAARAHSSCPSREQGGSLGEFGRGQMVPEFEEACLALQPGELSAPVKTQFGYHLIRLDDKKEAAVPALAEVKEEIRATLLREKQQKAYQSKVNQLRILFPVDTL